MDLFCSLLYPWYLEQKLTQRWYTINIFLNELGYRNNNDDEEEEVREMMMIT